MVALEPESFWLSRWSHALSIPAPAAAKPSPSTRLASGNKRHCTLLQCLSNFPSTRRGPSSLLGSQSLMVKRAFDMIAVVCSLPLLLPLLLITGCAVWLKLGRPILFQQPRAGYKGRSFILQKFRTMSSETDEHGTLLADSKRLTRFGALLRRTSLDELPSLWNVLVGDMSLVGPRPLLVEYLPRYTPEQMRRHEVRPGITGLAQISGRRNLVFSKRLELDAHYVDTHSFWLDLKILFLTLCRSTDELHAHQEINDVDDIGLHSMSAPPTSNSSSRKAA